MATEKVIEIKVLSEQAQKNINDINGVIDEQRAILVLLEEEYLNAKKALDDYNASNSTNLAQEKSLKKTLKERKDALQDQRLGLKKLAIQQREANREAQEFRKNQKETTNVIRGIDKLTGGFATKVVKLGKGFKSGVGGIKSFIVGLSGVKKALLATGIGALVVLVGTLIANFDKIKTLLLGISKESENAAKFTKETAEASKQQLDNLEASNNILKLQGKTEKEIRDLKRQQTNETILALEASLKTQKTIRDLQIEASERNKKLLTGILNFILTPIKNIATAIDAIGKKFGKDFGLSEAVGGLSGSIAGSLFSGIDEEGTKAIEDTEKILLQLRNKRAGFELKDREELEKKREQAEQDFLNEMFAEEAREDMRREAQEARQAEIDADLEENRIRLQQQFDLAKQQELEAEINLQEAKANAIQDGFQVISQLAGKNKALAAGLLLVEKGLAIGQVISNAAKSIAQAKANLAATPAVIGVAPNPLYAVQAAATAKGILATKLAAATSIATIAAQAIPTLSGSGGGGGGGSAGGLGGGGADSQAPSFNVVGATETSQLADAIGGQTQQPVQAFVVANDVTTAQSLENNIVEGATL
tara:strand:+ start:772 stop:2547 length:1776 start_codon:yes stop_codon:yes gene_type:complete